MQSILVHDHGEKRTRPGFSLVATLPLLVLLFLIAAGFLSLTSSTARKSFKGVPENEAQANARLALMLALGELQEQLGPDQRVSAPAGILDANPATGAIEGVTQPHWVGVWSTEWSEQGGSGDGTPWARDDDNGGLRDERFTTGYDREQAVLSFLVSGNEGGRDGGEIFSALDVELANDAVLLVGPGSTAHESQHVKAPRIATSDGDKETGAYAFWVGDLGVKAHVGLVDNYRHSAPKRGDSPEGMERLVNAQDVEESLISGLRQLENGEARRLVTDRTFGLGKKQSHKAMKRAYHDMTTWSRSVLANVRGRGLQRDLTAFLNSEGDIPNLSDNGRVVSRGLRDLDNMMGPANPEVATAQGLTWQQTRYREISPRFAMLRKWNQIGNELPWAQREREMIPPSTVPEGTDFRGAMENISVYDRGNLTPASFLPLDTPNLSPVMVEASLYYNLATYPFQPVSPNSNYGLRVCLYPRIALWNPYRIEMNMGPMIATMFVNGSKDVRIDGLWSQAGTISFGRGSTNAGAKSNTGPDNSPNYYSGWIMLNIPPTKLEPGETLVFSPRHTAEYSLFEVSQNEMSASVEPHPSRYFWQDMGGLRLGSFNRPPETFIETGGYAENYMMSLKDSSGVNGVVHVEPAAPDKPHAYDSLPLIVYVNPSLQAGGSGELPVLWNANSPAQIHRLASSDDILGGNAIPDVRTRDGFRLRWWREHRSNIEGSGQLRAHPEHLQSSLIGTWNPRAAYTCRTPFDNLTNQPPYFYGMYTRDLFDREVSWQAMRPRLRDGKMLGNPFGPPDEGHDAVVLFDVPRAELGIPSLGHLRHLKLSEFGWSPSYAVGNSLADPRVGRTGTVPLFTSSEEMRFHGWNEHRLGWAPGRDSGRGPDYWAWLLRQVVFNRTDDHQVVHDLSYELNHNLWDDYFVSTGNAQRKRAFVNSAGEKPLPNGRFSLFDPAGNWDRSEVEDFHRAASRLMLDGGFNVHSISKDAWKAILASAVDTRYSRKGLPFPRLLNPPEGEWHSYQGSADDKEALAGFRSISKEELGRLAEEIVREVKERAPFFGLSDFINRRLVDGPHGEKGPLEAAISAARINKVWDQSRYAIDNDEDLPDVSFDNMVDSTRLDQTLKPDSVAWGIPGYLTQGDIVQILGSTLRPRSDTFVVRAYGEAVDSTGKVTARAWCEAIVQRTAQPVKPDSTGLNPDRNEPTNLGRRFETVSFRWLDESEI